MIVVPVWFTAATGEPTEGWLQWRGPQQNGTSSESTLPDDCAPEGNNLKWTIPLAGRGTPVIARDGDQDRVYLWGHRGEGPDLQEL